MLKINQVDTITRSPAPLAPKFSYKSVYTDSANLGLAIGELYNFWTQKVRKPSAERIVFIISLAVFSLATATQFLPSSKSQLGVQNNAQTIKSGNQSANKVSTITSQSTSSQHSQSSNQDTYGNAFVNNTELGLPLGTVTAISDVYLRSYAGSNGSIVDVLKYGQNVELYDDSNPFWFKVAYIAESGQRISGFVGSRYVTKVIASPAVVPSVEPGTSNVVTPVAPVNLPSTAITTSSAYLYSMSVDGTMNIGAQLPEGLQVQIISSDLADWSKISYLDSVGEPITGYVKVSMLLINSMKI